MDEMQTTTEQQNITSNKKSSWLIIMVLFVVSILSIIWNIYLFTNNKGTNNTTANSDIEKETLEQSLQTAASKEKELTKKLEEHITQNTSLKRDIAENYKQILIKDRTISLYKQINTKFLEKAVKDASIAKMHPVLDNTKIQALKQDNINIIKEIKELNNKITTVEIDISAEIEKNPSLIPNTWKDILPVNTLNWNWEEGNNTNSWAVIENTNTGSTITSTWTTETIADTTNSWNITGTWTNDSVWTGTTTNTTNSSWFDLNSI